jgi:hypothetical protein
VTRHSKAAQYATKQSREQLGDTNEDQKHPNQAERKDKLKFQIVSGTRESIPTVQLHKGREQSHGPNQQQYDFAQPVEHAYPSYSARLYHPWRNPQNVFFLKSEEQILNM